MPSPAISRLSKALNAATHNGDVQELLALAERAGVNGRLVRRAVRGIDINAGAYLKLCGAIGIDPVTGKNTKPQQIGDLSWSAVGCGLRMSRMFRRHGMLDVEREIGDISKTTISRVEHGEPASIDHLLAICRYIGPHPHHYVVSLFHGEHKPGNEKQVEAST